MIIGLFAIPLFCLGQTQEVKKDHKKLYSCDSSLDVNSVLDFPSLGEGTVKEVTVWYNMIRSNLEADWLYNGQVMEHITMPKGLRKFIKFNYNKPLNGGMSVRFTGPRGQVQVTRVGALVDKIGEKEELHQYGESKINKQKKYKLLSQMIKISLATKRKDYKLAYKVKKQLITKIIEQNLMDEKTIRSNISKNKAITILADRNTIAMSGQIKGTRNEKILTSHFKKAAKEVKGVKLIKTDLYFIKPPIAEFEPPVYELIPFVPDVTGKSRIEAEETIEKSGYRHKVEFHTSYKKKYQGQEGKVVSQSPEAGKQKRKGSEVKITVYNPSSIPVPNVAGKLQEEAEEIIVQAGYQLEAKLQTGCILKYQQQVGKVIQQSPKAGTTYYKGPISITVYSPSVPSVVGSYQEWAEKRINDCGFLSQVEFYPTYNKEYSGKYGKVVIQSPDAGTQLAQGLEVKITMYQPPAIPDVIGKTRLEAQKIIEETGFYLLEITDFLHYSEKYQGQETKVVLQNPGAETERFQGNIIRITVYNPSVPNVVGNSQEVAEERIEKRGFLSQVEFYPTYNEEYRGKEGQVVRQSPEPDMQLAQGLEVLITVYNPPAIPDVIGKTRIEAEEIIKKTGYPLEVKYFTSYQERYKGQEGKVVFQNPQAGVEEFRNQVITVSIYDPASTPIPSVIGKSHKEAEELLAKSGFLSTVEFIETYKAEYKGQKGKIVAQSPDPGTEMVQGSEVKITVYNYIPIADLKIESINHSESLVEGELQSFSVVVRNSGDALPEKIIASSNQTYVRVSLKYKKPRESDWQQIQEPHRGMINIKPGQTQTYTFSKAAVTSLPSGDYLISGIVDEWAILKDRDVQNNSMEKNISIESSPIIVKSFPSRAAQGQKIILEIDTGKKLKDPKRPVSLHVRFNDLEGSVEEVSGSTSRRRYTLYVIVPDQATTGPISVSADGSTGRSNGNIHIFGPPTITSISPQAAPVRSTITIKGTNFVNFSSSETTEVCFTTDRGAGGWKSVKMKWISENEIQAIVPVEAKSGPLKVTTIVGSKEFSTTSNTTFHILPEIKGFNPKYGNVGTKVRIYGSSIDYGRNPQVTFNNIEASIQKTDANTLEVTVPVGASTGKIKIKTDDSTAESQEDFRIITKPKINTISPAKGPEGTVVTIEGEDLDLIRSGNLQIPGSWGDLELVGTPSRNRAQLRIPTGINRPGSTEISVWIPPGSWSNKVKFELTADGMHLSRPQIVSVLPAIIFSGGIVTLGVTDLPNPEVDVISVFFNGVKGKLEEIINRGKSHELKVKVPQGATSGRITLSTYGVNASGSYSIQILGPPSITGFSPQYAKTGKYITIIGTDFVPERAGNRTLVSFVSASGQKLEVNLAAYLGDTEIRVKVPMNAVTGPITVTTFVSGHKFTTTSEIDFIVE